LKEYIDLYNAEGEVDIEGMDYSGQYLWFTGSMSQKREKVKGDKRKKDIQRLGNVTFEQNRYMLGRVPVQGGELFRSVNDPHAPANQLRAAALPKSGDRNILLDALQDDEHLGAYVSNPLPSKENGLDIEGLAVRGNKLLLGLRGPVLAGWAMLLEIEVEETEPGVLGLCEIGDQGRLYKKHFLNLGGRGIRDLVLDGDDLIILAGPTMDVEGTMLFYRLADAVNLKKDSLFEPDSKHLQLLFALRYAETRNHPEGMAIMPCLGEERALLVVYDLADEVRMNGKTGVYADVYRLK
jgi:hypothetical protein